MAAIRRKLHGSDDGDRQMVQILSRVRDDGLQAVAAAFSEAPDHGVHSAPVIINNIAGRREPSPPPLRVTSSTMTDPCLTLVADTSLSGAPVSRELGQVIARCGRPTTVVGDNGTRFTWTAILS